MSAVELATGYISLAVSTQNISSDIAKMFKGADTMAGKTGRSMGQALKSNFEDANKVDLDGMRKSVEVAEGKITATIERNSAAQAKAKRAVEIAEAELEEKRNNSRTSASQLMKAEDKLTLARQKSEAASMSAKADLEKYNKELANSKSALAEAEAAAGRAAEGSVSAWAGVGQRIKAGLSGDFKTAFNGVEGDAAASANDVAGEFTQAGDEAAGGFSDKMIGGLKGIGGLAAAAGIGVSLAEGITGGMEREKLGGKLAAQLNLAGPDAARAGDVAGSLFAGAWGESLDETHDAVSAVMSSIPGMMDAPAASLEGITAKALDMATAFDLDVNESVGAVGVLLRNGLAKDATAAFDLMVGGMQRVPAGFRDELLPAITEYGKHFAGLGITGADAMGMLVKGGENGAIGIDKVGDAVKEFQIRATDLSDATGAAYETIGVDMVDVTNRLLAGGETASGAMGEIVGGLMEIGDPAEQAAAAIALFGTPLEDLSVNEIPDFLGLMDPAGDAFDDFGGAAERMGDTLNNNTATAFEGLKRSISMGFVDAVGGAAVKVQQLAEALRPVGEWLGKYKDQWGPFAIGIGLVAGAFGAWALASAGATVATGALAAVMGVLTAPITGIIVGLGLLVGSVIYAYKNIGWFRDMVDGAWQKIKGATASLVSWWTETVFPAIVGALEWVGGAFRNLWEGIVSGAEWVSGAFSNAWDGITGVFDTVVEKVRGGVDAIKQIWSSLIRGDFIGTGPLMEDSPIIGFIFDLREAIAGAIGWIKGAISNVADWFSGTIVPNFHKSMNELGQFFDFLYRNFIAPFVWLFKMAMLAVTAWFRDTVVPAFRAATALIGAAFTWLNATIIQPVWRWIRAVISAVVAWFQNTVVASFKRAAGLIGAAFRWLNEKAIQPAWRAIRGAISAVMVWFNTKRLELQARIAALGEAFKRLYNAYVKPVWDWIKSKIQAVGNWFRDVLVPAFRGAIQRLADKFSEFKARVNTVWEGVKTLLRNGWNWISGNVFDPMKSGLNTLKDSFTRTKDGIGKTWDKLRAKVKEPIAFVVNKVINPFIGGYNDMNNFWSGTDLKEITGFHTGGYTGPGSKYQPAGVVHADEYVIRKESQNDLSRNAPGLLDNLNKYGSKALGYARGGLVRDENPANMAIGARVFGAPSFTGPNFQAIARTGELNVAGSAPAWSLDAAIKMADAATAIKVKRGNGDRMNGVTARTYNYPHQPWDGYYQADDGSISLNNARAMGYSATTRRTITAHEIGHALGLPHAMSWQGGNGARSIMNYDTMLQHNNFTPADVAALSAIYGGTGKAGVNGGGGDGGGIGDWIAEKLKKIATAPIDAAKGAFKGNKFVEMPLGMAEKFITDAIDFAVGGSDSGGPAGEKQVAKWMTKALKMKGMFSETNLQSGVARAMKESGGDPGITQGIDDVNSRSGNHARGLMQVIPPTFAAHKEPGYDDIFNPIDNILASINYTVKRYGSLVAGWNQPGGYADGGLVKPGNVWDDPVGTVHRLPQGVSSIYNGTGGAEYFQRVDPSGGSSGPKYHIENFNALDTDDALRKLRRHELRREALAYVA